MKKVLFVVLIILVIAISIGIIARNSIAKNMIEKSVYELVNQKLTIGSIDIGLFNSKIDVTDVKIDNPTGYSKPLIADMPELFVHYSLIDILRGYMHLPELRININQTNIEKDKNNVINLKHFEPKKEKQPEAKEEKNGKETKFLINKMVLNINTITYKDNTKKPITDKEFKINFSKTFTDVTSSEQIIMVIKQEIISQLAAEGVNIALNLVTEAIKTGDIKSVEKKGKEQLSELQKQFSGETSSSTQEAKPEVKTSDTQEDLVSDFIKDISGSAK